jgi:hypothetical protein
LKKPLILISALCWTLLIHFFSHDKITAQTIAINEIMASNAQTIFDEDGDYCDWLEFYNYGAESINLLGFGLSDNAFDPFKWTFPDITLEAGHILFIWASGKNRTDPENTLHTNFRLNAAGEELLLTRADSVLADHHLPIHIPTDISYGRYPDGTGEFFFYDRPTPNRPNRAGEYSELLYDPEFSHASGFYPDSFYLKVNHSDTSVILRYTLDGSVPNINSPVLPDSILIYDRHGEPDEISAVPTTSNQAPEWYRWYPPMETVYKGTNVRVKGFKNGALSINTSTRNFWVDENISSRYTLPVISLSINKNDLFGLTGIYSNFSQTGPYWEKPAHVEFFEPDGTHGFATDAGIRVHGGNSRRYALKSFRLCFRNQYGESYIDYPVFPDQEVNIHERLILRNGGSDWAYTYFRDAFAQNLLKGFSDVGTQAYRPAVVFLNGEYWGVMNIRERLDNKYIEHYYGHTMIDMLENTNEVIYGSAEHYNDMISFLRNEDINDEDNMDQIRGQMDTEDFRDYHIAQIFSMNTDQPGKNVRFWRPQTHNGKWRWLLWDMDDTFLFGPHNNYDRNGLVFCTGLDSISDPEVNRSTPPPGWAPNGPEQTFPLRALLMNENFRNDFINRFADLLNTAFQPHYLKKVIDSFHVRIYHHMDEHYKRWHRPNPDIYKTHLQYMHDFAENRHHSMREHIINFFELEGQYNLHVDIGSGKGHIRVNSIDIASQTPSLEEPVYPWKGVYFRGPCLRLEANPAPGYVFSHWKTSNDEYVMVNSDLPGVLEIRGKNDISVKAYFKKRDYSIKPPVILNPLTLERCIEGNSSLVIDLNDVFHHPNGEPMNFTAESERPAFVNAQLNGSVLELFPLRRGDATINISANDGVNEVVDHFFRVLVYPEAFDLSTGDYFFGYWYSEKPELTYPDHMLFLQSAINDPPLDQALEYPYYIEFDEYHDYDRETIGQPYNNTRRTRVEGLGQDGISFINTGRKRDLGGALIAINTIGRKEVSLSWVAGTLLRNEREYAIRVRYRQGISGEFTDLKNNDKIVEYASSEDGDLEYFDQIVLPEEVLNKEYIQLLWQYHHVSGENGPRAKLRLDDIVISAITDDHEPEKNIKIYPNPASGTVTIKSEIEIQNVRLFNISGQLFHTSPVDKLLHTIDVTELRSGLYFMEITTPAGIVTRKVQVINYTVP